MQHRDKGELAGRGDIHQFAGQPEKAAGGRRTKQAGQNLGSASGEPKAPTSGGLVTNVEPLPDPPFQS